MKFWENVLQVLKNRNISLRALAKQVGVTPGTLSKYAHGTTPGIDIAARIARFLNVSLDTLVWGEQADLTVKVCPAPDEHRLLRDLTEELGLEYLLKLASLATQSVAWEITRVLIESHPAPQPLRALEKALPHLERDAIELSLLALKRRQVIVEERDVGAGAVFGLQRPVAEFSAREIGDLSHHVKRAVRSLFCEVLPAIERRDGTGVLLTVGANVPPEQARALAEELRNLIKTATRAHIAESGTTAVSVVFGLAISEDSA